MSTPETARRFVELMRDWLMSLPHDLKVLSEAASDENLDRPERELAAGAIIYVISPNDAVSADRQDFLSYCDDCLLLRLTLRQLAAAEGEDMDFFRSRFGDVFEPLAADLAVCEAAMGELYGWLAGKVDHLRKLTYKGKTIADYLDDDEASEMLYEDGLVFATEYPVDEEALADKLKKASTVLEFMQGRKDEEVRRGV